MRNKAKKVAYYVVIFCALLLLNSFVESRADDLVFKAGIERYGSLSSWATWFSSNWGGRVVPQGMLVILLQLPDLVYSILTSLVMLLLGILALDTFGISLGSSHATGLLLLFVLLHALLPFELLRTTVYWKCACVLYVWGLAALLVAIRPMLYELRGDSCGLLTYAVAVPAIVYTASFEQAGAVMAGWMVLAAAYHLLTKRALPDIKSLALLIFALVATFGFSTLPGNDYRMTEETIAWFQSFDAYSLVDKILLGTSTSITMLEREALPIIVLICMVLVYLYGKPDRVECDTSIPWDALARAILVYFVFCEIRVIGQNVSANTNIFTKLYTLYTPDKPQFVVTLGRTVCDVIHYMAYVLLGCCFASVGSSDGRFVAFSSYFAGFCSMFIMGFSPTIYASGSRPRFICYFILVCLLMRLLALAYDGLHKREM